MSRAVDAITGVSPVRKRGRKGHAAFFRANLDAVKAQSFKFASGDGVDLLAHGRQTVLPPSTYPEGAPYVWLGVDTLEHVRPAHLPELPDDIADQLALALAPFGYVAQLERPAVMHAGNDGDSIWKETNEAALGNFDAWVPALRINARREGAGWRAQAAWRNGDGFNVSFHPKGIRDFAADVGYSAIDVVAKVASCEPHEAMRMLRDKLGLRDPEPVEFRLKMKGEAAPEPFEAAPEPETGKPPGDDALMKIVRAYAKARIANNGDHPKLTDDLRQVYRENFPKIALYQIDPTEAPADLPKSDKTGATSKFALTWLADINLSLDDEWLLKGLVPKTGVVSVFGNSRSFKTFLLIHLAVRGALGRHFGGHQCRKSWAVRLCCGRGPQGR